MDRQQDLVILIRDVIDTTHGLAMSLEKIVTSFERLSGRIGEERELSVVTSQFAGLHQRAEEILNSLVSPSPEPGKSRLGWEQLGRK